VDVRVAEVEPDRRLQVTRTATDCVADPGAAGYARDDARDVRVAPQPRVTGVQLRQYTSLCIEAERREGQPGAAVCRVARSEEPVDLPQVAVRQLVLLTGPRNGHVIRTQPRIALAVAHAATPDQRAPPPDDRGRPRRGECMPARMIDARADLDGASLVGIECGCDTDHDHTAERVGTVQYRRRTPREREGARRGRRDDGEIGARVPSQGQGDTV